MKIDDKLYRMVASISVALWEYACIEVRQSKETSLYVMECEACSHGSKCHILVAEEGKGVFRYVSMVNNEDHDYWHKDCEHMDKFFITKAAAKNAYCDNRLRKYKEELTKLKESVVYKEKVIEDLELFRKKVI